MILLAVDNFYYLNCLLQGSISMYKRIVKFMTKGAYLNFEMSTFSAIIYYMP